MAQPPRSSEPSLKNPIAFRVTKAEQDEIDALVEKYGDELPERSRGAALRRAAHDVVHGVVVPLAADERSKLDRLVDARRAELARFGVRVNVTPADVLLHLLGAATVDSVKVAAVAPVVPEKASEAPPVTAATSEEAPVVVVAPVVPEKASEAPTSTAATAPAPVVVVDVAPVVPEKASEAPPVTAATSEEAPVVVVAPVKRKTPPTPDAVRAALVAATSEPGSQKRIGDAAGIEQSALSKFKKGARPLPAERLAALAAVLTKEGHL